LLVNCRIVAHLTSGYPALFDLSGGTLAVAKVAQQPHLNLGVFWAKEEHLHAALTEDSLVPKVSVPDYMHPETDAALCFGGK